MNANLTPPNGSPELLNHLEAFGELSIQALIAFAADGQAILVNRLCRSLFELPTTASDAECAELLMQSFYDVQDQPLAKESQPHWRLSRGELVQDLPIRRVVEGKQTIFLLCNGRIIHGPHGPEAFILVFRPDLLPDTSASTLTALPGLQLSWAYQNEQIIALFSAIPDGIVIADSEGRIIRVNDAAREIINISTDTSLPEASQSLQERYLDGRPLSEEDIPLNRALRGERINEWEHWLVDVNGNETRVSVSASPIQSGDSIIGAVAIFRDVTQRRAAADERDQRLRELEGLREIAQSTGITREEPVIIGTLVNRLAQIVQAEICAILMLDEHGQILVGRAPAYGLSIEEIERLHVPLELFNQMLQESEHALIAHNPELEPTSLLNNLMSSAGFYSVVGIRLSIRNRILGLLFVANRSKQPFNEGHLRVLQTVAPQAALALENSRLYTRERLARSEAQMRSNELMRANADLDAFTYTVSHDLRAPLRAIKGFTALLERELEHVSDRAQHQFQRIRSNVEKMSDLIDDLLTFSRTGRRMIDPQEVDLMSVIRDSLHLYGQDLSASGAQVRLEQVPVVLGDARQLEQVFNNLIGNAIKYRRPDETLRLSISGRMEDGVATISVEDNGSGFDMRHHDKIFQVFQRLHDGDNYEGTGIGLAIVHKIITRHNGQIWAESKVGEGTTFFLTLPVPDTTREDS